MKKALYALALVASLIVSPAHAQRVQSASWLEMSQDVRDILSRCGWFMEVPITEKRGDFGMHVTDERGQAASVRVERPSVAFAYFDLLSYVETDSSFIYGISLSVERDDGTMSIRNINGTCRDNRSVRVDLSEPFTGPRPASDEQRRAIRAMFQPLILKN